MAVPMALALHGGCGTRTRQELTPDIEAAVRAGLERALEAGWHHLRKGSSALDAVTAAVIELEDDPQFNAGHGAVFTSAGTHELDACVMVGQGQRAGAVAGSHRIRNPILAARAVMEHSEEVLLAGPGADAFAEAQGLAMVDNSNFSTDWRRAALAEVQKLMARTGSIAGASESQKHGTVGAVALDRSGGLAAATSTGGFTNKPVGRIGDTPIPGAGTWADENVAISLTGRGEFMMRLAAAKEIAVRVAYRGTSLGPACAGLIRELDQMECGAGLVAVDKWGRITMPYNTQGMYRASISETGARQIAIFRD
ncbi:MAG: isoaspartyl peptidase/L-asparaginase [Alphaproteobacteria bacterium]|nr:MAG: isoaspartyl peptidase/L-asparaginase [Alphaproteobacteria bacterium]